MNISLSNIYVNSYLPFKNNSSKPTDNTAISKKVNNIPAYNDDVIKTNPAQLSLFHMHDFHGQTIRMERAYSAVRQFDNDKLINQNNFFNSNVPVDKLKVCSGDMFLGENLNELSVVNEFLNIAGVLANTIGNHECDTDVNEFAIRVKDRKYRLIGVNMHPDQHNKMNSIVSNSFIAEIHGNKYGFIGLVPPDMPRHMKRPDETIAFNISDLQNTLKDIENDIKRLKEYGVNKIILLSHAGLENDKYIAQNVSDIDIILGGHTHNLLTEVKEGENLFYSPKGEPVVIMQVGRDGEFIGIPNIKFNEFGQITNIQYNVLKTDEFPRDAIAKTDFETILGKPEIVGKIASVDEPPADIYAQENPHCNFILDCLKSELDTDIAVMNSANIRGRFYKGDVDTRQLRLISPFANKIAVIEVSEEELINSIDNMLTASMKSPVHRPGIIQVSGLEYKYSPTKGKMTELFFVDKNGIKHKINLNNPQKDKMYTLVSDDFCIASKSAGLNLKHRLDTAIAKFNCDKDEFVAKYLKKQTKPSNIKADGRIIVED